MKLRAIGVGLMAGLGLALLGLLCVLPYAFIPGFGPPSDPGREAALKKYFVGHDLFDEGKYDEAAEHYMPLKDFLEANEEDSSEVTGLIGRSLDLAGRTEEAEQLIEASLAAQKRWYVCVYRAHFLARHENVSAAITWLKRVEIGEVARSKALSSFYRERGDHAAAIPILRRLLKQVDKGRLLVGGAISVPGEIDVDTHNAIAGLLDPLRHLAESHLHTLQLSRSYEYASLGIRVGQVLSRDSTYAGSKYVEAGDFRCRIARARVSMERGDLTAASTDIGFAQAIADWSNPPFRAKPLRSVIDKLKRLRRGR
jgi:hypothetical protein